jgi:CshA-type fibril repeat protein
MSRRSAVNSPTRRRGRARLGAVIASIVLAPAAVVVTTAGPASALPPPPPPIYTVHKFTGGDGTGMTLNNGNLAVDEPTPYPLAVATGPDGKVYLSFGAGAVYEVDANGVIEVYAGIPGNNTAYDIDGPALSAKLIYVNALAVAPNGDLYISDNGNNMVFKVDHVTKMLTKIAGDDGSYDPNNNGVVVNGPAVDSPIQVQVLHVDKDGNLYLAGSQAPDILKIDGSGQLTRFAGTGTDLNPLPLVVGDPPIDATSRDFGAATGITSDADGNIYLSNANSQIVKVDTQQKASVYAGTGTGHHGDPVVPGPATDTHLEMPMFATMDADGNLFFTTYYADIWRIDEAGDLSAVVTAGPSRNVVDGGPAAGTHFGSTPTGFAVARAGDGGHLYITEPTHNYVWRLSPQAATVPPDAPTGLSAVALVEGASLTFTAPVNEGSSAITKYQYSRNSGTTWIDLSTTGTTTVTGSIGGLAGGSLETLVVRAVSDDGESLASNPAQISVLPRPAPPVVPPPPAAVPPSAPRDLTATAGDQRLDLSFRAPASLGGAPVSRYEYTVDGTTWVPLGVDNTADSLSYTITGLTNGASYAVVVRAVNSAGPGTGASVTSSPAGNPPAPSALNSSARSPSVQRVTVPLATGETVTLLDAGEQPASVVTESGVGTYRLDGSTISFTPVFTYSGTTSGVRFRVTDAGGLSGTAVYTPTVTKPSTPAPPPVTSPNIGGGAPVASGKQGVTGQLQPGQTVGLVAPGLFTLTDTETTTKVPVAGQGTYQLFRSGLTFTITFVPEPGFIGRTSGITYRISDQFGQYVDAVYRPTVAPPPLPKIDRSGWAPVPSDPRRTSGKERRTRAFNSSYRGYDAYPSTALGVRLLGKNQATTLAGGTVFVGTGATLSEQGRAAVRRMVRNLSDGQSITCEGYGDYAATAAVVKSQSTNRARTVCAELKAAGAKVTTTAVSYGALRPAVVGGTVQSRVENQRVVIVVTG